MNFLYPAFLLGALAIAIPVALHFMRRDVAPDLPFTAVRFLRQSRVERSRRRRLRDILLLAARVAALLLLAAAFARPFAESPAAALQPLRIVAIDRSFSMAPRFDEAVAAARTAIDEAGFTERVALMAFDERADVIAPPGAPADARVALGAVRPGHGGTRFAAVMAKAEELASGADARLIVISDLQRAGFEGESRVLVPGPLAVETRPVAGPPSNVAVASVRAGSDGAVAAIRNASGAERRGRVVLSREGSTLGQADYVVAAHATVDVPVAWTPSAGGVAVSIADEDGFAADNTRYLVVGAGAAATVLIVTSADTPGFYLSTALGAARADGLLDFGPRVVTPAEIAGGRASTIAGQRAVVLLSTRTLDRQAREAITAFVRGGGGLLVAAAPDVEPEVVAAMFGWRGSSFGQAEPRTASFTATDTRHPIFRPFGPLAANLGQVRFARAWRVNPSGWHAAAHFDDGTPAMLERAEGAGRVVLFTSDLDRRWNDFPLHPSFVPFAVEAVRHVAARRVDADDFMVGRAPAGVDATPGLHRLPSGRQISVNVDPRESATSAMTPTEFAGMLEPVAQVTPQQAAMREAQTESRQNLWQIGLILMLATLVVESFIGRA